MSVNKIIAQRDIPETAQYDELAPPICAQQAIAMYMEDQNSKWGVEAVTIDSMTAGPAFLRLLACGRCAVTCILERDKGNGTIKEPLIPDSAPDFDSCVTQTSLAVSD